ncbi:MAG: hypothetical protein QOD39_775, partial [Mycobacterium sp.]|nr:hypothetical protein [Mycobacterium sp.]
MPRYVDARVMHGWVSQDRHSRGRLGDLLQNSVSGFTTFGVPGRNTVNSPYSHASYGCRDFRWCDRSGQGVVVSGAQLRAERVLVNLLALLVFGHFVTQPLAVAVEWRDSRYPLVALFVPAVGLVYGLWLLREAGRSDCRERRSVDVVFIALICAAGLATEVVVSTPLVAASMTSAGYTALGACTFAASFRLSRRASAAVVLVAAIGHVFALRATPTQGVGGALQLLGTWAATTVVVAQVRRAGRDADAASD